MHRLYSPDSSDSLRVVSRAGYAWLLVAALVLLLGGCVSVTGGADGADGISPSAERAAIRAVMDAQLAAWNAGDTAGFMDGYARRDDLRFASGGSVTYGWQQMLDRYRTSYPTPEAMGTLDFRDLDIDLMGRDHAVVFGSWHLARGEGYTEAENLSGLFTLLFERVPRRDGEPAWRITHDHTSSAN